MKKALGLVILATIFSTPKVISQISIGGVINDYSQVTTIDSSCGKISVVSIGPFMPDDLILIIQMQGAEIDQTDFPASGSVTNLNNAGFYELAEVGHIAGTTISLKHKLVHTYDPDGKVQVVKIPIYNNAQVTSPLTATAWNGNTGGVLALKVIGTLELQADIHVNSTGFRGGSLSFGTPDCDEIGYAYPDQSTHAARKGEGISIANVLTNKGRGAHGNGGGGGNEHNGGGGGGSNLAKGGQGGDQWSGCTTLATGGQGGKGLSSNGQRIFMGGGGGAGHQNEGVGSAGMAGGGILVIIADHLAGNGHQIESNGGNALESGVDGAGGGGSGGTIVMDVGSLTGAVSIRTNGGHGGNNKGVPWMNHCIAPGGGGSGGVLYITKPMLPPTVFFNASGGNAGQILSPSSNCYLTSYGAESGEPGFWSSIVELTIGSEENTAPVLDVNISNDSICLGDSVILKGIGSGNLVWTNGVENGVPFFPPLGNSGYTLTLTDPYGCSTTEHVQLFVSDIPDLNDVPGYYDICQKSEVQIDVGNLYKYTWSTSDSTSKISVNEPGIYSVVAKNEFGCVVYRSFEVLGCPPPIFIPNAFSPNGDGINDVFKVLGEAPDGFRIRIFDRWGELIFESTSFNTGWDGSFRGQLMDPAVFVYDVEFWYDRPYANKELIFYASGHIHLVR